MDNNPFSNEVGKAKVSKADQKLYFVSGETKPEPVVPENFNDMSTKERSTWLLNFIGKSSVNLIDKCFKKVSNPIINNANNASNIFLAQKTAMQGDDTSEIYRLIALLSNKRPYVGMKAATILESKLANPQHRTIIENYFKFNADAQSKYSKLYSLLKTH